MLDVGVAILPAIDHEVVLDDVGRSGTAGDDRVPALVEIASPDGRQPAVQEEPAAIGVVEVTIFDQAPGPAESKPVVHPRDLQLLEVPKARALGQKERRVGLPRELQLVHGGGVALALRDNHQRAVGLAIGRPHVILFIRRSVLALRDDGLAVEDYDQVLGGLRGQLHGPTPAAGNGFPLVRRRQVVQNRPHADAIVLPGGNGDRLGERPGLVDLDSLLVRPSLDPDHVARLGQIDGRLDYLQGRGLAAVVLVTGLRVLLRDVNLPGLDCAGGAQCPRQNGNRRNASHDDPFEVGNGGVNISQGGGRRCLSIVNRKLTLSNACSPTAAGDVHDYTRLGRFQATSRRPEPFQQYAGKRPRFGLNPVQRQYNRRKSELTLHGQRVRDLADGQRSALPAAS